MCNGPWKDHGAQYYECSKYKEDETVGDVQEQVAIAWTLLNNLAILFSHLRTDKNLEKTDSRVSLSKYLHYFQRWENHCRSLKLEKKFMEKLGLVHNYNRIHGIIT